MPVAHHQLARDPICMRVTSLFPFVVLGIKQMITPTLMQPDMCCSQQDLSFGIAQLPERRGWRFEKMDNAVLRSSVRLTPTLSCTGGTW
jgi:hypothetical protein